VERVGAPDRVRAAFVDRHFDPRRGVDRYQGDLRVAFGPEQVEELGKGLAVVARAGPQPQQSAGVVVDRDGQILVPLLVADLVDVLPVTGGDGSDGAPGDAHQIGAR
jgi:hypothetical protein